MIRKAKISESLKSATTPSDDRPKRETPEIERPEIGRPEIETPEIERPEIETPEIERPEIGRPKIGKPTPKIAFKTLRSNIKRIRDDKGRYIGDVAFGNAGKTEKDMTVMNKLLRFFRSIFDWNFIASFIRFLTGYVLIRATPMEPITNNKSILSTAWFYISSMISKFVGWSIVVTIIFTLFQALYRAMNPYIIGFSKFFYGSSRDTLFSSLSNYYRSFFSPPKSVGVSSWIPTPWQNASAQAPWWSASWVKLVLGIVALVLSLIVIRKLWFALLKVLVYIFGWATPGDLEQAQHMVKMRVDTALDEVRTLGNMLSVMDKSLAEFSKTTQVAKEVLVMTEQIKADMKVMHEFVGKLETTKVSLHNRLDKMSAKEDAMQSTVYAALKHMQNKALAELEKAHTPRGIMGKALLDEKTLNSTYNKMRKGTPGGLASILIPSDPVGEEMGGWHNLFERQLRVKNVSDPTTSRSGYSSEGSGDSEGSESSGPGVAGLRSTTPKRNASGSAEQLKKEHAEVIKGNKEHAKTQGIQNNAYLSNWEVEEACILPEVKIEPGSKDGTPSENLTSPKPE